MRVKVQGRVLFTFCYSRDKKNVCKCNVEKRKTSVIHYDAMGVEQKRVTYTKVFKGKERLVDVGKIQSSSFITVLYAKFINVFFVL